VAEHHKRWNSVLFSAVSMAALTAATGAWAQQQPAEQAEDGDEIVITGFRASLADALDRKRESDLIQESITAEDIGEFPDRNIAESLARLPGVQVDRVAQGNTIGSGQGQRVLIRGLSQNVVLLNEDIFVTGLELFTFGEGNDRNTDSLESIPADLLGGVDVFKSPNASLLEGGMGGIVNLRTRSPFDFDGTTFAANVRYGMQEHADEWTPMGTIVVSHEFGPAFAVLGSISYEESDGRADILGGANRGQWRFSDRTDAGVVSTDYFAPEYRYLTDRSEERERLAVSLAAGLRINSDTTLEASWFHTDLDIGVDEASLKMPFGIEGGLVGALGTYEIDANGVLESGLVQANSAEVISYVKLTEITSDNFQLDLDWDNGGPFRARFRAAYSTGEMSGLNMNNDVRFTQYRVPTAVPIGADNCPVSSPTGYCHLPANPGAPANFQFEYENGELPSFNITNVPDLLTNPNYGFFKSHWVFGDNSDITNYSVRSDFEYDWARAEDVTLSGGVRFAGRDIDYTFGRYLADYTGLGDPDGSTFGQNWTPYGYFQDGAIGFKICDVPIVDRPPLVQAGLSPALQACTARFGHSPPMITPFQTFVSTPGRVETIGDFWASGHLFAAGNPLNTLLLQDRSQMHRGVDWIQDLYPNTPFSFFEDPLQSFAVEERTTSAYLMADIGGDSDPYHINAGVRIIQTELSVDQNQALPNPTYWGTDSWNGVLRDYETITHERDYTDILPSINVVLDVTDEHKVRLSAARVVSRADLFELGRGFQTEFTRDSDPMSPTFNLFLFTSGSAGNPELEPYRASQFDASWEYYFGNQGLLSATLFWKEIDSFITRETQSRFVMDQAGGRFGPVLTSVNGEGGSIRGFEIAGQLAFDNGFGFAANYTFSDSESPTSNDIDSNLPIPGVAENAYNVQVYYENGGFAARLSYAWRDQSFQQNYQFSDSSGPNGTVTMGVWNQDYGQVDGQISYALNDRFELTIEGINLTEESMSQYFQYENMPFTYATGSRSILIGGRVRLGGE
jgi:iron complex outermembrane recepter protein